MLRYLVSIFLISCIHTSPSQQCGHWDESALKSIEQEAKNLGAAAFQMSTCERTVLSTGQVTTPFKVHSIRKSLLNALYGIYVERGIVDLNSTLDDLGIDDKISLTAVERQATVQDLLRSRSGIYIEASGETAEMEDDRPERGAHRPREFFYYNNWDFNALGTIFTKLTKQSIFDAFQTEIANKIGMQDFSLGHTNLKYETQSLHPVYQFRMSARDLTRFGQLYLSGGIWDGNRILSEKWIAESFRLTSTGSQNSGSKSGFGYLWWGVTRKRFDLQEGIIVASGLGTQRIYIIPKLQTVIVFLKDTDHLDSGHPEKIIIGTRRHDQFLSRIVRAASI